MVPVAIGQGEQSFRMVALQQTQPEPFCSASSFISPAWGETNDGLLPASSTHGS